MVARKNVMDAEPPGNIENPKYWAFISYSHADASWGDLLHRKLEGYRVPRGLVGRPSRDGTVPPRLYPIFRDREELPVSSDLGANLKISLEQSRYLIVICSPNAARSQWVNEEVRYFKARRGENRLLCLIVGGEPNATDEPAATLPECFPPAVRYRVLPGGELGNERTEPIAADARPHADGPTRARLKLLAGLLGVDFDELWHRERRRRVQRVVRWAAIIALLTVLLAVTWSWAARGQERRLAVTHFIEQGRHDLVGGRRLQAVASFAEAWHLGDHGPGLEALLRDAGKSLVEPSAELRGAHTSWVLSAAFSDDRHVVTAGWDMTVRLWDLDARDSRVLLREPAKIYHANLSPDRQRIVTALENGVANVWSLDGTLLARLDHGGHRVNWAEFSPDGTRVLTAADDHLARLWNLVAGAPPGEPLPLAGHEDFVKTAVFSRDGTRVLTGSFDTSVKLWDAANGARLRSLVPHPAAVNAAALSPDGTLAAVGCLDGSVWLWNLAEKDPSKAKPRRLAGGHAGKRVNSVAFGPDGTRLVTSGDDRSAKVWDVASGELLLSYEKHRDSVLCAAFSPDGQRVVTASRDTTAAVFDVSPRTLAPEEIVALARRIAPLPTLTEHAEKPE